MIATILVAITLAIIVLAVITDFNDDDWGNA